ncbi:MAG: DNA repair protein RecO [Fimbriimonadaceae bacterium]
MAERSALGIVVRRRDSGESDRVLTILTSEFGKIDAVAKGARKSASRLASSSEPLAVAYFTFAEGRARRFVTRAEPRRSFPGLRQDFDRLTFALALAELYAHVGQYEETDSGLHELLSESLGYLESHPTPPAAFLWAQVKLLEAAGFLPSFRQCVVTNLPVAEALAWYSPSMGGYLHASALEATHDRLQVRVEVLYALGRLHEWSEPPPRIKFAGECGRLMTRIWGDVIDRPLPALQAAMNGGWSDGEP